jgi:hypothetical protein
MLNGIDFMEVSRVLFTFAVLVLIYKVWSLERRVKELTDNK